jgi:transposase
MDEARFCLNPKLARVWALKGTRPLIKTNYSSGSIGVTAGYDECGNFVHRYSVKNNSEEFIEFLKCLLARYERILLILDNAAIHKSKLVKSFVSEHSSRLELFYLPPYSPELNATEECWRQVRMNLTNNRFFGSVDELINDLSAFFGEHKFRHYLWSYLCR